MIYFNILEAKDDGAYILGYSQSLFKATVLD